MDNFTRALLDGAEGPLDFSALILITLIVILTALGYRALARKLGLWPFKKHREFGQ